MFLTDGKTYDAYIAYSDSEADLNFVLKTLMPALQEAGYHLFVRDIDAIPGTSKLNSEKIFMSPHNALRKITAPLNSRSKHIPICIEKHCLYNNKLERFSAFAVCTWSV